jgi:hypothetical protein
MGLIVSVYRDVAHRCDCTNGGVSFKHVELTVINVEGPFEPTPDRPAVKLERSGANVLRLVPVYPGSERKWFMFGGNFAHTSDSRLWEKTEELTGERMYGAIAIHDRLEG